MLTFSARPEFNQLIAEITHLDSVGLGLLHLAKENLGTPPTRIRLESPQEAVMRILDLTAADADFHILR